MSRSESRFIFLDEDERESEEKIIMQLWWLRRSVYVRESESVSHVHCGREGQRFVERSIALIK